MTRAEQIAAALERWKDARAGVDSVSVVASGDALARLLRAALADVARLDQYRIRLGAWHSVFGTTQLTHAQARLEKAEADVARLTEERDRTTKALRRADSMLTAVRRIAENYHDVDATGDPLIWKACNPCAAEILNALEGRNDAG